MTLHLMCATNYSCAFCWMKQYKKWGIHDLGYRGIEDIRNHAEMLIGGVNSLDSGKGWGRQI